MKILLTGATGLIGNALGPELIKKGHQLTVISRTTPVLPFPCEVIVGDLSHGPIFSEKLSGVQAVFNLMGEPIATGRWTAAKKKKLVDSRTTATKNLRLSFKGAFPEVLISGSAIGYYGDRAEEELTEDSSAGDDFLASLCRNWEREAWQLNAQKVRVVLVRTGVVLSKNGGALAEMLPSFRLGLGGRLGSGRQWMSWIHLEDLITLLIFALENTHVQGPVNAVSTCPVRNCEFTKVLSSVLKRPAFFSLPSPFLKALFGEKSVILLSSQKVIPERLTKWGYQCIYSDLETALRNELSV